MRLEVEAEGRPQGTELAGKAPDLVAVERRTRQREQVEAIALQQVEDRAFGIDAGVGGAAARRDPVPPGARGRGR